MYKLKYGLKKKLESNLNLLDLKKPVNDHHDHDHHHHQEEEKDSASDLEIGKELEIIREIKEYKMAKKKLKLKQLKKRELLF